LYNYYNNTNNKKVLFLTCSESIVAKTRRLKMKKMRKLSMTLLMVFTFLIPAFAGIGADGTLYLKDINADKQIGLHDILYQMQLLSGMRQLKYVSEADSNGQIVIVAESGTIQGVVTEDTGDAEVMRIISDALVVCISETGERFTQKSGDDGSFRFESLQPGQHVLAVSQEGYYATRIKVEVETETVAKVNVRLKKMENAYGKVAGQVLTPKQDGQLRPLAGATVTILVIPENYVDNVEDASLENTETPLRKTQTDEAGTYALGDIPEGRYFVMASKTGYQKVLSIVSVVGGGVSKRNMVLFPELSSETGALMGKIVEKAPHISVGAWETYYPVQGAEIILANIQNGTVSETIQSVVSNKKGIFSFIDIPVGAYMLTVRHAKFEDYHQEIVIKPRSSSLLPVINPNGSLIGIESENVTSDDTQWTISDPADSAYAFLNMIQNIGSGCFCIDPYLNWHQDTQFVRIVLTRNELPEKAMISGLVYTIVGDENNIEANKPIPGATVVAVPYFPYPTLTTEIDGADAANPTFAPLPTFKTETNENGYYELPDLPIGYLVEGKLTYIVAVYAPGFASRKDEINVIPGEIVEHDVELKSEGVIATLGGQVFDGSVKCDDNSEKCFVPIENADVTLFPITETGDILPVNKGIHVTTDGEGKYFFPRLAAIEYQMIVNADNYQPFRQEIKLKSGENDPVNVALEPREQVLRVKGVVLTRSEDCSDGICEKPVAGAIVYAYPERTDDYSSTYHYAKTYTDENGIFRFYNVPEDDYHVVISARGFEKFEDGVHVPPEGVFEVTFYITPITEQGRLKGHVFNGAANCVGSNCIMNIPGAEITLVPIFSTDPNMNIEPMFHTISNERGYYIFEEIPAGKYQITVRADMFKPWEGVIEIPPGAETVQDITLLPESEISTLKGHVFDGNTESGVMSPVPNATVTLVSMKNATWIAPVRTETDEAGQYSFKDIPSGEYQLTVRADKYQPFETQIYIPAGETMEKEIYLEHFVGEAVLKGMVRDGSVRCDTDNDRCIVPIPGAHIQLYFLTPDSSMAIPNLETTSDDQGLYNLSGIPTGQYIMRVWADGYQERKDTIQIEETENEIDILLFPITPIAHLKGQILDGLVDCEDAADCILPVAKARIELIPEIGIESVQPYYTESDENGFYEFMDIPSGQYVININAEKYQDRTETIDIREGVNERNFELIPAILCENNSNCSKSEFCAKPNGECDGDGMCRQRPEACDDHYEPVCGCDGQTYSNECFAASSGINVLYNGECRPEPEYGFLKGTVYNVIDTTVNAANTRQPIAGADIYLVQALSSDELYQPLEFKTQSNDDGTYAFEKLPVGKYTIIVRAYGYQAWKGEIEIIENEATIKDIFLVSFSAEASLKGVVNGFVPECTDATNDCLKPIGDALIVLTPRNLITGISTEDHIETRSDNNGQYVFESLKSGEYTMSVEAADWEIWEHPVTILPGKENYIDVELKPISEPAVLVGMVRNGAVDCDPNVSDCIVGISGAMVVLIPQANDTTLQSMTAITDDSGQFKFEGLSIVRYIITIEADNYEPKKLDLDLEPGFNEIVIELMPVKQCKNNSECDADSFCNKQIGDCENAAGICTPRPYECIMIYAPVCGCDGRSYGNECIASSFGMNILHDGECQSNQ
jgi:hypothetical protein